MEDTEILQGRALCANLLEIITPHIMLNSNHPQWVYQIQIE